MMKKALLACGTFGLATVVAAQTALAQFVAPATQDYQALLGDSTAGSESGIYEIQPMVIIAIGVGVTLILAYTAWKHIKKAGGKV